MCRAFLRRSVLVLLAGAAAAGIGHAAIAQGIDPNIVNRVDSFLPPEPQTVLPTQKERVEVKRTESYTQVVEEKKTLTIAEREAKAKEMGIVVPLGLRSTTARRAYLNMRKVPTQTVTKVRKKRTRVVTKTVEKAKPRTVTTNFIGSLGDTYSTNASQTPSPIADFTNSGSANLQVLIPAGRDADTVALLFGPTAVRYVDLTGSSFDMMAASARYSRVLGTRYTSAFKTGGTGTTDLLALQLGGVSVFDPGFDEPQISILTPSAIWSRSNIGIGRPACGAPGAEAYCTNASVQIRVAESWADSASTDNSTAVFETTLGWSTPIKTLSVSATGSIQGTNYWHYPGGRQDLILTGSGNLSWDPANNINLSAGVQFTQQLSTQEDLIWNGFDVFPQLVLNVKFN